MEISFLTELVVPIVLVCLTITMICLIAVVAIREKESTITKEREKDFIDKFIDGKKTQLKGIPGAMSFKAYAAIMIIAPIVLGGGILLFMGSPIVTLMGVAGGILLPELIVKIVKNKSDKDFDEKYGRALKQMASTLRSGMTIQQAVDDVCKNPFLDKQIKDMFMQISSDIKVGIPIATAFKRASEYKSTCDTRDVAAAVAMQTEVGGSEATVVDIVSTNINKRIMLRKEIRTLFTTAKLTVLAMDYAPPILLVILVVAGGDLMTFYTETPANLLILAGIFTLMFIGSIISHKMMDKAKVGSD